jgi:hypothetical protein
MLQSFMKNFIRNKPQLRAATGLIIVYKNTPCAASEPYNTAGAGRG